VEVDVPILNSIDGGITDTIKGPCSYDVCSNRIAYAFGDLLEYDGKIQRLPLIFYELISTVITTKLPAIKIYCLHKKI
jgi:hypothetical protein